MDENKPGKHLAPETGLSRGAKISMGITGGLVLTLAAVYLGLCAYVGASGTILPNTTAQGVRLGGLTQAQAADAVGAKLSARFQSGAVRFTYPKDGDQVDVDIPGAMVGADTAAAAQAAYDQGRTQGFFAQGFHLVRSLFSDTEVEVPIVFTDEAGVDAILDAVSGDLDRPMVPTTWERDGDSLVFAVGQSGLAVDKVDVKAKVLSGFAEGNLGPAPLFAMTPITEYPPALNLESVRDQLHTEAADARLDPESKAIIPSVTGVSFDVAEVRTALSAAPEGSTQTVPLDLTEPRVSTETLTASLFRDVLGEASSYVSGSGNRKYNVQLAAAAFNERILLPGEVFSYNDTTGSRTAEKGYRLASVYKGGKSVDEIGGGICQPSSTLYYATLNANLKIVERHHHQFTVGYVPDGMDATVWYGTLDFRFENNSPYPIKLVEIYENSTLTVKIMGTKTTDTYVKMTKDVISTTAKTNVYEPDPTVPQGGAPVKDPSTPGHTGKKVNAYRNVYGADGKLISSTLESTNNYKKQDIIYRVNPADLETYRAGGTPGAVAPTPEVPVASPAIPESPALPPVVTGSPVAPTPEPPAEPTPVVPAEPTPVLPVEPGPVVPSEPAPTPEPAPTAGPVPPADSGIPVFTPPAVPSENGGEAA